MGRASCGGGVVGTGDGRSNRSATAGRGGPAPDPSSDAGLSAGAMLDHFRIVGVLGRGGMGAVFEAHDTLLDRAVAIKTVLGSPAATDPATARLLREARAVARIVHPNVLPIYHVGRFARGYYLVLELMRGGSLQGWVNPARPAGRRAATAAVMDACRGLAAAHAAGLVHRDVKPGNLMRDAAGAVKVADFGLVRGGDLTSSAAGHLAGTPYYMSPEQCRGEPTDERSDVYALGATYFALLTGRVPYPGPTPVVVMFAHCSAPVPDLRAVREALPPACAAVVRRAMAKHPADRFQTADEMRAALAATLADADADPPPPPPPPSPADGGALATTTDLTPLPDVFTDLDTPPVRRPTPSRRPVAVRLAVAVVGCAVLGVGVWLAIRGRPHADGPVAASGRSPPPSDTGRRTVSPPPAPAVVAANGDREFPMGGEVGAVAFSPNGAWFAAGTVGAGAAANGAMIWEVATGADFRRLARGERVPAVAFMGGPELGGGTSVMLARGGDRGPTAWWGTADDAESLIFDGFVASWGTVGAVAAVPNKRYAIGYESGGLVGQIRQYAWGGQTLAEQLMPDFAAVRHLAYSPFDDSLVAVGGDDRGYFWKAPTAADRAPGQQLPMSPLRAAAFAPDRPVIALSDGREVNFWWTDDRWAWTDAEPTPRRPDDWTAAPITALAFAPDGRHLATGDAAGGVTLWLVRDDLARRRTKVHAFAGHRGAVRAVAFAPDGRTLGTGGADGTARLWAVPREHVPGAP